MDYSPEELTHIRQGRGKFVGMASAYCLGVFNDNYFKQAALLLSVVAGLQELQGVATVLFALPFILFSAYAGWLVDRYPKRTVIISSKALELVAMMIGAVGIILLNWVLIIAMIFVMGLQSTLFNPALNGSIPELYPERYVPQANAVLKLATSLSIVIGVSLAGLCLDQAWISTAIPFGRWLVAGVILVVAAGGFVASLSSIRAPAAGSKETFPWAGPFLSLIFLYRFSRDRQLFTAFLCSFYFYFSSSLLLLILNTLGLNQLGLSPTFSGLLGVCLIIGVSVGALISAKISLYIHWTKILAPSALALGFFLTLLGLIHLLPTASAIWAAYLLLCLTGVAGGILLIPIASFIQTHPPAQERGKAIATSNFFDFIGIMSGGPIFIVLNKLPFPSLSILVLGIVSFIVAACLWFMRKRYD